MHQCIMVANAFKWVHIYGTTWIIIYITLSLREACLVSEYPVIRRMYVKKKVHVNEHLH